MGLFKKKVKVIEDDVTTEIKVDMDCYYNSHKNELYHRSRRMDNDVDAVVRFIETKEESFDIVRNIKVTSEQTGEKIKVKKGLQTK